MIEEATKINFDNVLDESYDTVTAQGIWDSLADRIPLKKIGIPKDVAQMVIYLSGETASFMTGSDFVIDGGMLNISLLEFRFTL